MPLLGLFGKKDKRPSPSKVTKTASKTSVDGDEYVLPELELPSPVVANGSGSGSGYGDPTNPNIPPLSRIQSANSFTSSFTNSSQPPPLPRKSLSSARDLGSDLLRPPSRTTLFSTYGDPQNSRSTRSLPDALPPPSPSSSMRFPKPSGDNKPSSYATVHESTSNPNLNAARKKPSRMFGWGRDRTKSKPTEPAPAPVATSPQESLPPADSFALKAFRHVNGESPNLGELPPRPPSSLAVGASTANSATTSPGLSDSGLAPPPTLRPRNDSVASDSSQRVSVALFREAQARRAASPGPSLRPPSRGPLDGHRTPSNQNLAPSFTRGQSQPSNGARSQARPQMRSATAPLFGPGAQSSSSESEPEDESESEAEPTLRALSNKNRGAQSELGHRTPSRGQSKAIPSPRPTHRPNAKSEVGHASKGGKPSPAATIYSRPNASSSTSALNARPAALGRMTFEDSDSDETRESMDSDDAPLASRVQPQTPRKSDVGPTRPLISLDSPPPLPIKDTAPPKQQEPLQPKRQDSPPAPEPTPPTPTSPTGSVQPAPSGLAQRLAKLTHGLGSRSQSIDVDTSGSSARPNAHRSRLSTGSIGELIRPPTRSSSLPIDMLVPEPESEDSTTPPIHPVSVVQRSPQPAFAVTSRPHQNTPPAPAAPTVRMVPSSSSSSSDASSGESAISEAPLPPRMQRPGITTVVPSGTRTASQSQPIKSILKNSPTASPIQTMPSTPIPRPQPVAKSSSNSPSVASSSARAPRVPLIARIPSPSDSASTARTQSSDVSLAAVTPPAKPFAGRGAREESPASSVTGDSSSGRYPPTPRDGSDIGVGPRERPAKAPRGHGRSVSEESTASKNRGRLTMSAAEDVEAQRKERRRSEAKAAIELGNIVNGRGPISRDDDSDDDVALADRGARMAQMNSMNPMMTGMSQMSGFQAPLNPMMTGMSQMSGWGMPTGMMNPQQFMPMQPPSNADPAFLAAHQQAMHIAKQAYQMAVAQQAMAAAADEWERQSNAGGSVYGFPSSASSVGGFGGNPMMGMGGWGGGGMMFSSARSAYGGSVYAGSEAGWGGTRSVYGETFGPDPRGSMYSQAGDRRSRVPPVPSSTSGQGRSGQAFPQSDTGHLNVPGQPSRPRPRTKSSPGGRSGDGSSPSRTPPPSSWTRRYETALRD